VAKTPEAANSAKIRRFFRLRVLRTENLRVYMQAFSPATRDIFVTNLRALRHQFGRHLTARGAGG